MEVINSDPQSVKANFFKNALNEETQVDSLLAYHRQRIANFENERGDWLQRYEQIKIRPEESHRTEWELRQLKDSIAQLQKSLSDGRVRLFEERQLIMKIQNENTQLKKKANIDQQVKSTLVTHCNPIEQTVVYQKGHKPGSLKLTIAIMMKYVNNDLNLDYHKDQNSKNKSSKSNRVDLLIDKSKKSGPLFKTVVLNEEISTKAILDFPEIEFEQDPFYVSSGLKLSMAGKGGSSDRTMTREYTC
jgi:hypothetical protein